MNNNKSLTTEIVNITSRALSVKWTMQDIQDIDWDEPKVDISKLTVDEQADLIVKKLSEPPKPKQTLENILMEKMSRAISEEIDKEMLEILRKGLAK